MKKLLVLWLAVACIAPGQLACAQGSVQFLNTALSKLRFYDSPVGQVVDAPVGTVVGLYWGQSPDTLSLLENTVQVTTAGFFNGGSVYAIPGTNPGQQVYLQIAAWLSRSGPTPRVATNRECTPGIDYWGESSVVQASLGPASGPGTVIWQSPTGLNPNRMKPFEMFPACPEPSVYALSALGFGAWLLRRRRSS